MAYQKKQYNNNGYNNNQGYAKQPIKKRSGAKTTTYEPTQGPNKDVKQHLTTGWKLNKGDLISVKAVTTAKSKLSEKGWFGSVAVTFTNTKTGEQNFHWGTMEKKTGKVVVDALAFVMNPKAKNGGYCGTYLNN